MSPSPLTFRAQLVIPEQRELFDYWLSRRGGRSMPSRGDIEPKGFKRHLGFISLIDVESAPRRFRYRLVGTGLRHIYGRELTGRYLDEQPFIADGADFDRVVDRRLPVQGVMRFPLEEKDHLIQFWLKLPLSQDGQNVTMLLCYDAFLQMPKAMALTDQYIQAKAS